MKQRRAYGGKDLPIGVECVDVANRDAAAEVAVDVETLSEDLLDTFRAARLLDTYDVYQHLMGYWAETMQDDVYMIGSVLLPGGASSAVGQPCRIMFILASAVVATSFSWP